MTITALRSLHAILGEAIEDIDRVYAAHGHSTNSNPASARQTPEKLLSSGNHENQQEKTPIPSRNTTASNSQAYASPPPSPSMSTSSYSTSAPSSTTSSSLVDFPSLDAPCDPTSLSEALASHPEVLNAISRIVAAAGQMSATVQTPFLTLCDAIMGYHLPSCMRLLEASHVVEILREAGPDGLHVESISEKNGVQSTKLAHILRLLATHHILREVSPDVFTLNRISSIVDSGKIFSELKQYQEDGIPQMKYSDSNGVAAFVGLCTDEIQKASAYMTETYYLSPSKDTREGRDPGRAPFCFAFDTAKTRTGFFGWLEGEVESKAPNHSTYEDASVETGRGGIIPPTAGRYQDIKPPSPERLPYNSRYRPPTRNSPTTSTDSETNSTSTIKNDDHSGGSNANRFRLERFGKAMSGTDGWEAPGAALNGFDWHSLSHGSIVVDVGGGIGSTSMLLASAFSSSAEDENGLGLQFIIQDRPVVCEMGEKAWKAKCPELLESTARFQVHNFFTPQPVRNAAVFLLRVVLHDWPDNFARKILLRLREAAMPETKLIIADFVLPLACPEDMKNGGLEDVEGAETAPVPLPLLPNLGKASANVYWMDLTMQTMFNSQERTLRELVSLALSAGWKIIKVTRTSGSLFGYLVAEPAAMPEQEAEPEQAASSHEGAHPPQGANAEIHLLNEKTFERQRRRRGDLEMIERASSRCGTPTFGSNTRLSSVEEALSRFGGGMLRAKGTRTASMPSGTGSNKPPIPLKPALSLSSTVRKKKPSPLSVPPLHSSPSLVNSPSRRPGLPITSSSTSPRESPGPRLISRRMSLANLRSHSQSLAASPVPPPPLPLPFSSQRQPPPSPLSPSFSQTQTPIQSSKLRRRASHAQISPKNPYAHKGSFTSAASETSTSPMPSMIPVRLTGPPEPASPKAFHRGPISTTLGSPIAPSRLLPQTSSGPRRASTAHHHPLPTSLRKRSGTVVGTSLWEGSSAPTAGRVLQPAQLKQSVSEGSRIVGIGCNGTLENNRMTMSGHRSGTVLNFDSEHDGSLRGHGRHLSTSMLHLQPHLPVAGGGDGGVSVLAAAARIDRGDLVQPPSSPDST